MVTPQWSVLEQLDVQIIGSVDRLDRSFLDGWVTLVPYPEDKISLEVLLGDKLIGQCVADRFREDLLQAGIADGTCAFSFAMPTFVPQSALSSIRLRLVNSIAFLDLPLPKSVAAPAEDTPSAFGGLWIDRAGWIDKLALKHRRGEISDTICQQIFSFVRDGYLIIPAAVDPYHVDQLNQEIDNVWDNPPPGLLIETFEPDGVMRYIPPDKAWRDGRTKMLDHYAYSAAAREAITAPKVMAFLAAIFDDKPKAFQGLTYWKGSQQPIHKDTAYVKVDSNPMHLAATWLALEDVIPGSGELEYYIGSHRAPDYLFGGTSKWMESNLEEHAQFLQSLHEDAAELEHVKGHFLARKGDVLVWHADFAHGDAVIQRHDLTRKSLLTHFTTAHDDPFYRRTSQHKTLETPACVFVSQYVDIA